MRKLVFIAMLTSMVTVAMAQDNMTNKKGVPILPEAGDYSIGIDAVPFIDWAFDKTRIFSNTGVTSSGGAVNAQVPGTFVFKYMKDATTAYRARVGINFMSHSQDHTVHVNNDSTDASNHFVTDNVKTSSFGITLGAGIEKHRGKGRLHGIYGAEAMLMFGSGTKNTYSYGNNFITATTVVSGNQYPTGAGEANVYSATAPGNTVATNSRTTESKSGSNFGFGIDGFVGVEYFLLAKMSVSAEYNWGISISSNGEGSTTTEYTQLNSASTAFDIKSQEVKSGKSSDFNIMNGDINTLGTGSIVWHFYF